MFLPSLSFLVHLSCHIFFVFLSSLSLPGRSCPLTLGLISFQQEPLILSQMSSPLYIIKVHFLPFQPTACNTTHSVTTGTFSHSFAPKNYNTVPLTGLLLVPLHHPYNVQPLGKPTHFSPFSALSTTIFPTIASIQPPDNTTLPLLFINTLIAFSRQLRTITEFISSVLFFPPKAIQLGARGTKTQPASWLPSRQCRRRGRSSLKTLSTVCSNVPK